MVVLPAPVWPTMATVSPGSMVKLTSRRTQSGSGVELCRRAPRPRPAAPPDASTIPGTHPIGKPNMIKLDPPRPPRRLRHCRLSDLHRGIQQLEHPLARRHRRLQNVVLLAQILNGAKKPLRILDECNEHSQGNDSAPDERRGLDKQPRTKMCSTSRPPNQITQAMAIDERISTTG